MVRNLGTLMAPETTPIPFMKYLFFLTLLFLCSSSPAQVILNGGMEAWPSINYNLAPTNWNNFSNQGIGPDPIPYGFSAGDVPPPPEGVRALRVYSLTSGGEGIDQTISLSAGNTYTITAQVKKSMWNGSFTVNGIWDVFINGVLQDSWGVANENAWETRSTTFVAPTSSVVLGFRGRSTSASYASLGLDDVAFDTPLQMGEEDQSPPSESMSVPGTPAVLLYPNPAQGTFNLHLLVDEGASWMRMYDPLGKQVKEQFLQPGDHRIEVADLEPGIYLVKWGNQHQMVHILR